MNTNFKERFQKLKDDVDYLIENKVTTYDKTIESDITEVDKAGLNKWIEKTTKLIGDVYGIEDSFYKNFTTKANDKMRYIGYVQLREYLEPIFISAMEDLEYANKKENVSDNNKYALERIKKICSRFHYVSRQLQARYNDRNTLDIEDEYDVQDLLHSLLKIDFDDIRPEEYSPSYASSSSRVDFLLKKEKIVIEVKKTRNSLKTKEIGEQLIIDIARYKEHPDCELLVCFIYDPEAKISNPAGLINDLEKNGDVKVIINPI